MDTKRKLLEALRAHLQQEKVNWSEEITETEWQIFFRLASLQQILPMVFDAVYLCPAIQAHPHIQTAVRKQVRASVMVQAAKTADFLILYRKLLTAQLKPLVVKGLICRSLYPNPDFRQSGDEDVYISSQQYSALHQVFQSHGMIMCSCGQAPQEAREVSYQKQDSGLYIEVHKSLFPEDSQAYGTFNYYFESSASRAIQHQIQGIPVWSLNHTDHLLYLILHALKHFIHSGFGIRQVCDIVLYANSYGPAVDWDKLYRCCLECHAHLFTASILQIGIRYLTLDPQQARIPSSWLSLPADCEPMLDDLLSGSVFGAADASRQHSATITLNAVAANQKGKSTSPNIFRSIFPPAHSLSGKYPYLNRHPYLVPIAWAQRIFSYSKELQASRGKAASKAIQIGAQRVELLKKYEIIQ